MTIARPSCVETSHGRWAQRRFLANGNAIVAVRYPFDYGCHPFNSPAGVTPLQLEYFSLWYSMGRSCAHHEGEWKMSGGHREAQAVLFASEPLTRDESTWLKVPEHSRVTFDVRDGCSRVHVRAIDL